MTATAAVSGSTWSTSTATTSTSTSASTSTNGATSKTGAGAPVVAVPNTGIAASQGITAASSGKGDHAAENKGSGSSSNAVGIDTPKPTWRPSTFMPTKAPIPRTIATRTQMVKKDTGYATIYGSEDTINAQSDEVYVTASNEYGVFERYYPWLDDVAGSQLVEPYKETTLTLSGSLVTSGYEYSWSIVKYTGELEYNSLTQKVTLTAPGVYPITVNIIDSKSTIVATYTTLLICKYVKREIRELTVADREAFLNAFHTLWEYDQEVGVAKFGDKYTSMDTLVAAHSMASNDIMCDAFHDGSGFLTHHLALTNGVEAAMRAVDPSVTMHYWDFTIEGEAIVQAGKVPSYFMEISPILTDTWFGSVDDNNHIADSRWARTVMPLQRDKLSSVKNSYGIIRSYWNNNPDPEINRFLFKTCGVEPVWKKVPACEEHWAVLNAYNLGAFQQIAPGDGHGPMHVQLGGVGGGCAESYASFLEKWGEFMNTDVSEAELNAIGYTVNMNKADMDANGYTKWKWGYTAPRQLMMDKAIMGEYFHIYRSFWRSHMCAVDGTPRLLVCPDTCDPDSTPFEECTCEVSALLNGKTTWQNLFPCVLSTTENQNDFLAIMPEELVTDMMTMLATSSVIEGDMIESSSPQDPLFWMIHTVIERMLSAKRLPTVTQMGTKAVQKWEFMGGASEHWVAYSYYDLGLNETPMHREPYTCVGHSAEDEVLPPPVQTLTDAIGSIADFDGDGIITNYEFYTALDPNEMSWNDYVFAHFRWDHCTQWPDDDRTMR